ncbi:Rrf2 family transcriptional regulator [uncultured Maritimibacter sp.]|jgi:Rrf2 family nitric oxide-sensitive transcriptional repressor|uniref:RrF2 family transcriptional regulator n=1 Tax=uncultured Maritimibacter sp. TaxID=991866 RepID=UPI000AD0CD10|nr:Rrf2 family transcriptional regulator [uncultured Maritimibacter sp.]
MHLSKFTDYAIRVCLYLGVRQGDTVKISEIAQAYSLSQSNLMKVVNRLVDGGYLRSQRGRSGGVTLAFAPQDIRMGEVARFMEGETAVVDCACCLLCGSCGLTRALREAQIAFYTHLDQWTVADALNAHPRTLGLLLGNQSGWAADTGPT